MPKIPYGALQNPEIGANTFGSLLLSLADKALELNCSFYRHDSSKFLRAPENSLGRIFWNWVCEPYGELPPPPRPPFFGGQCEGYYTLKTLRYTNFGNFEEQTGLGLGKVSSIFLEINSGGQITPIDFGTSFPSFQNFQWGFVNDSGTRIITGGGGGTRVDFLQLVRVFTEELDNCGNPPEEFPPPEGNPPSAQTTFTFNYTNYDNSLIEVDVEFKAPNFELNIRPSVNIGDLNFRFDIDGIEITKNTENNTEIEYPNLLPEITNVLAINALDYTQQFNELNSVTGIIDNSIQDLSTKVDVIYEGNNNVTLPIINDILEIVTNIDIPDGSECPDYTEELQEINEKLEEILQPEITFPIAIGQCTEDEEGNPVFTESTIDITANKYLASGIMAVNKIQTIESKQECLTEEVQPVLAVPEWWGVRIGGDRPQIVAIFRKANSKNYHSISIPHPKDTNIPPTSEPLIPAYTAGNIQATLFYKDGSKFTINCNSIAEAERIVNIVIPKVKQQYMYSPLNITYSERKNGSISESLRIPVSLKYYSTGQKNLKPDWIKKVLNI